MSKRSLLGIFAVVIVVAVVAGLYFFRRPQQVFVNPNAPFEVSGAFIGPENAAKYGDGPSLIRLIHGYYDGQPGDQNPTLFISAQMNWPKETPQQIVALKLLPQTEFLCWPTSFTTGDGTTAQVKDTIFLLDNDHKLFVTGQRALLHDEAMKYLQKGMPVMVALQEPYTDKEPNTAFQIAILGCQ